MTLKQLHQRLGEIIAEHERKGWGERNDQPVIVFAQNPSRKRRHDIRIQLDRIASGSYGVHLNDNDQTTWTTEARGTVISL
jgi:hypothetical protein